MIKRRGKRIIQVMIGFAVILLCVFFIARFGWRLRGFNACDGAGIVRVEVYEDYVEIEGYCPGVFPKSFVGYIDEIRDGKMYIGVKFNAFFGVWIHDTGDFHIKIPVAKDITCVYLKTGKNETLLWER